MISVQLDIKSFKRFRGLFVLTLSVGVEVGRVCGIVEVGDDMGEGENL